MGGIPEEKTACGPRGRKCYQVLAASLLIVPRGGCGEILLQGCVVTSLEGKDTTFDLPQIISIILPFLSVCYFLSCIDTIEFEDLIRSI